MNQILFLENNDSFEENDKKMQLDKFGVGTLYIINQWKLFSR